MIIYKIKLPKEQDPKIFARFMQEEYFPSVSMGPTRVGQVTDLVLLQGHAENDDSELQHHFFWQVGWSGLDSGNAHSSNEEMERKLKSFHASIKRIGMFKEVAAKRGHA